MGCGKSKAVRAAEQPELQAGGQGGQGCGSPAQHHLPCQTLPKNPATGVSGPSGSTGTTFIDPRAQLRAYIDSHPVVIFSKSSCTYCTEVKKLFKSMRVPYFLLELDQAEDGRGLEGALSELTSETGVPVVFVKRRKIGGYGPTLKVRGIRTSVLGTTVQPITERETTASLFMMVPLRKTAQIVVEMPPQGVPCIGGGAFAIMPVDEYWLCLPASHGRPFVQTVRVTQSRPHCCWRPGVLPSVPEPSRVPAGLPRGSHSAAPPPPPSTAPPSTPQTSCPADPELGLSPPTSGGSQEKNVQSRRAYQEGRLQKLLTMNGSEDHPKSYDYDLIIIGGGSGGLAAAKEAAKFNKKVMVLDFVTPTPLGTRWGLGGTCVNVGCIPKKLMHQAALLGQALRDSRNYGWTVEETVKHDWDKMTEAVQNHIGSLNWGYRVALREKKVTYENAYGQFVGPHRIKATNNKGREKIYSAERFLIATGERPRYLGIPGDKEYCISSDDLFSLPYCPGKTLVVGASYVALECAGFLAGIGLDVTVMVRSILLRGFDQDMANKIGEHMEEHGVKFIKQFVPIKVEQIEAGAPGRLRVVAKSTNSDEIIKEEYNTVLLAIGRDACTRKIGLETVGVKINEKTGKIPVTDEEQTNVPYIYAIGDILEGKLELTPVAIQAGRLLAQRLYGGSSVKCDYENVPTTVFTPLEYGACGLSEEKAVEKFGEENVEVYHSYFWPLEWTIPSRDNNKCYAKVVCNMKDNERVVGFHVLGPNAGEVTQGFAAALKCGLTKKQLDSTIGIHPVCAEVFTTLSVTKRSGGSILQTGC